MQTYFSRFSRIYLTLISVCTLNSVTFQHGISHLFNIQCSFSYILCHYVLDFLFLPLPQTKGLNNYYRSLRFLAVAYFNLAVITAINLLSGNSIINFYIELTVISFQSILFAFSLISLMNSNFTNIVYILRYMTPTFLFIILLFVFEQIWGNPGLKHIGDFIPNFSHPMTILNIVFLLFCIAQLIYLSIFFIVEAKKYELKLNDYFADTYRLQLHWVRYYFYGAVAFCIVVLMSLFFLSPAFTLVVILINIVFYTVFGICYIQYQRIYINISLIFDTAGLVGSEEPEFSYRALSWEKLKCSIIVEKYYLCTEINIEQMAQYLKIGRSTLSNYINREEKMSFHSWINTLRIEEAKHLILAHPDYSIAQISDAIGFSEPSNFSRQFKHITHQTPSVWRQNQLKNIK